MNIEESREIQTPIIPIENKKNRIYIKRDDLLPCSFGGNKARKAKLFFEEVDRGNYDCIVTYGSSSSNHCRIVSNMAAQRNLECYIISAEENHEKTYNSILMKLFKAHIIVVPVQEVSNTIDSLIQKLKNEKKRPYFIAGGGHGNLGTKAYLNTYREIKDFEQKNKIFFDYIFFASGTGTTQAGLVCGQLLSGDNRKIVGISIARKNPRGRDVIIESIKSYIRQENIFISEDEIQKSTYFVDDYIGGGYGKDNKKIEHMIKRAMIDYGVPLDKVYTGKAFWGMSEYIQKEDIRDKNILFIHTGGTPLFFDFLNSNIITNIEN